MMNGAPRFPAGVTPVLDDFLKGVPNDFGLAGCTTRSCFTLLRFDVSFHSTNPIRIGRSKIKSIGTPRPSFTSRFGAHHYHLFGLLLINYWSHYIGFQLHKKTVEQETQKKTPTYTPHDKHELVRQKENKQHPLRSIRHIQKPN